MSANRVVVWFSCGAASAVAARIAVQQYGRGRVHVVYCDTAADEHPDNERFLADVERWLGVPIERIAGEYGSVDEVFEKTRYMAGIGGARCTVEMKKRPRFGYEKPGDVHVFGFTADETDRAEEFALRNAELDLDPVLIAEGITKGECFAILATAGIQRPAMYDLGYDHNNCLGCVKATSATYWNKIRQDFPDVFEKRARQSRELDVRLTRVRDVRVFLDELPADYMPVDNETVSCGPDCGQQLMMGDWE